MQGLAHVPDVLLHDVIVVEQPVRGRSDVQRLDVGLVQLAIRFIEDPARLDEAGEEARRLVPGVVVALRLRERAGAGGEVLGAEQLASEWAGDQVLERRARAKAGENRSGDWAESRMRRR